jgi:hypothetical protein
VKRMHECEVGSDEWWDAYRADGEAFDRRTKSFERFVRCIMVVCWLAIWAAAFGALSGCGMSQLERHTTIAGALHAATGLAAQVIDAGAQEAADAATSPEDLAERMEPWRRAEAGQHLAAAAVDVYVAEVLRAAVEAAGDEPDMSRALAAFSHALSLYRALADLLATYGVELPGVARVLAAVGGAL